MRLTIYVEDLQNPESVEVANEIESATGIEVYAVYDIPPNNTEITIDAHGYRDGEDVEDLLRAMGYTAVFDR